MSWLPGPAWLFCPADRPDRYLKALAVADIVVLDLEDAVAGSSKGLAREHVRQLVAAGSYDRDRTVLRINGTASGEFAADLDVVRTLGLTRVMLAKAERASDVESLEGIEVVALIETPAGVVAVEDIAAATNVVAIMWGADDLVAGLGGTSSRFADGSYRDYARYTRSRCLIAAKVYDRIAIDAVYMDIPDTAGLALECQDAAAVGFDVTCAIHPSQIEVIRTAFTPTAEEIESAQHLIDSVGTDPGVTTHLDRMVDGPIIVHALRVLRRAGRTGA